MTAYRNAVHNAIVAAAINPRAKKGVGINKIRAHVGSEAGLNSKSHFIGAVLKADVEAGILSMPTTASWKFAPGKAPK